MEKNIIAILILIKLQPCVILSLAQSECLAIY